MADYIAGFKEMMKEYLRVLKVTKKPTSEEFRTIVKVSGLGMLAIGAMGFIIQTIRILVFSGK
jgi:protein transport protein SEC61 subunit gamma and related proteins